MTRAHRCAHTTLSDEMTLRLWTLHPRYLDAKGLVALWREGLLAQKVLQGKTKGYRHHPQLQRFRAMSDPQAAIATYLHAVLDESRRRGYEFDGSKIACVRGGDCVHETRGQLLYEWRHLLEKLTRRDLPRYDRFHNIKRPAPHPLFRIVAGEVQEWERVDEQ
jgi:hypothetical protein